MVQNWLTNEELLRVSHCPNNHFCSLQRHLIEEAVAHSGVGATYFSKRARRAARPPPAGRSSAS
ncbi:hypothetical protein EON66_06200, partial [archaeon]